MGVRALILFPAKDHRQYSSVGRHWLSLHILPFFRSLCNPLSLPLLLALIRGWRIYRGWFKNARGAAATYHWSRSFGKQPLANQGPMLSISPERVGLPPPVVITSTRIRFLNQRIYFLNNLRVFNISNIFLDFLEYETLKGRGKINKILSAELSAVKRLVVRKVAGQSKKNSPGKSINFGGSKERKRKTEKKLKGGGWRASITGLRVRKTCDGGALE